jgi:hypothetical protein
MILHSVADCAGMSVQIVAARLPGPERDSSLAAMKAIVLRRPGGPDALEYTEVPTPAAGDGEVLVKADTIGVSMPEVLVRRGRLCLDAAAASDPRD